MRDVGCGRSRGRVWERWRRVIILGEIIVGDMVVVKRDREMKMKKTVGVDERTDYTPWGIVCIVAATTLPCAL